MHRAIRGGQQLRGMAPLFVSKEAGKRFLGYMHGQRQRLLGLKGQKRVKRPELDVICGYDCKYACHILRLGLQGIELLQTGRLKLPMTGSNRTGLMEVRRGEWPLQAVLTMAESLESALEKLLLSSDMRDHPDREAIENWMQAVYWRAWR